MRLPKPGAWISRTRVGKPRSEDCGESATESSLKGIIMSRRPNWWLSKRNKSIGTNRAEALAVPTSWSNPAKEYDLYHGIIQPPDLSQNSDVQRGLVNERVCADQLKKEGFHLKPHPQTKFMVNERYPWAHSIPDRWMLDKDIRFEYWMPVQIKCPRPARCEKIRLEGLPKGYMVQAAHTLATTGARKMVFAIYNVVTVDTILVPIEWDDAFIASLMEIERRWMEQCRAGQRPDETIAESGLIDIPVIEGEMQIISSAEAVDAARAYLEAKSLSDEAEDLLVASRDRLFGHMEDSAPCCEIRADGSPLVRCHRIAVSGARKFDAKKCVQENPDMEKYYTQGKAYTQQRVYPLIRQDGGF